ncbi:MAG: N-formylglutamate amidohydrolase [Betaproteobacteria bacterium]
MTGRDIKVNSFIVTCEHGGNRIPAPLRRLFRGQQKLLDTHRGFDPGALIMAHALARSLRAPLVQSTVSRLVVDLNRSIGHPRLFSSFTRHLPADIRASIIERHYRPYRTEVEHLVERAISRGRRVIHLSSHSFTPVFDGRVRTADVGLLYHPTRPRERALCAHWKAALAASAPAIRVRRNYPYAGRDDGLTSWLRRQFSANDYVGVELEVNQGLVFGAARQWTALRRILIDALHTALILP